MSVRVAPASWRPGWTAARPCRTPAGCGRSPGPSPPAGAGRRRAPSACARGSPRGRACLAASATRLLALLGRDLGHLQREAHVVGHRHVRVERVVLEDHRDVAVLGRRVRDVAVADEDLAVVDLLQPGEHPQGGRLAAPRGPDEHHELAVVDLEVDAWHGGLVGARIPALRLVEGDCGHAELLPSPAGTCRTIRSEVTQVTLGVSASQRCRAAPSGWAPACASPRASGGWRAASSTAWPGELARRPRGRR